MRINLIYHNFKKLIRFQYFNRSVKAKLLTIFTIYIILFTGYSIALAELVIDEGNDNKIINKAGKQRFLSEKMIKLCNLIYIRNFNNSEGIYNELRSTRGNFELSLIDLNNHEHYIFGFFQYSSIKNWENINEIWNNLKPFIIQYEEIKNLDTNTIDKNKYYLILESMNMIHAQLIPALEIFVDQVESEGIRFNWYISILIIIAPFFGLLVSIGIMYSTKSMISDPINKLEKIFRKMSIGEFDTEKNVVNSLKNRKDEIGQLYESFQNVKEFFQIAEEGLKIKNEFLANVNHEIRSPLLVISGVIEDLEHGRDLSEQNMKIIKNANRNLHILITDILDFSKIDAGQISIRKSEFSVHKLIKELLDQNKIFSNEKLIEFDFHIDEKIPDLLIGDEHKIKQILNNLLINATKYTEVGSIEIFVSIKEESINDISILFRVEDSGHGIPDNENVFEKFVQGSNRIQTTFEGIGIGLSISKRLTEVLNGKLWYTSEINIGTSFYLELNFEKTKITVNKPDNTKNKYEMKEFNNIRRLNGKVLYVDDFEDSHDILKLFLKKSNLEIECTTNGKYGLELVKKNKGNYDIYLIDLKMPEMDGYSFVDNLRKLNKRNGYEEKPMIAITAYSHSEEINKALSFGFSKVLVKPYKRTELVDILIEFIQKK